MKKTFKSICRNVGNIFWLIKPYWKYAKFYFILTLFFWIVPVPLTRILMVIFPAKIVELLDSGSRFSLILGVVILFQLAFMLIPVFEDFYIHFFKNRMNAKLDLLIKRNVYKKALGIDYEYIDNPDYYDKYTWTVDNHAEKSGAAFSLLNSFISAIVVIVSLVGIIASNSPIIVILCALSMVIRTYAYMRYNRVEIEEENEKVPVDRKLGYFHRLFYLRDYSADLKSTSLKKSVFVSYDKESENKVGIIKKFGIRFFWLVSVQRYCLPRQHGGGYIDRRV